MKSHILLTLSLIMLFKPLWPVAEYVVNYQYIVNVLCENKDQPELNCDGTCYLAKQMSKESQKSPFTNKEKLDLSVMLFCNSLNEYQPTDSWSVTINRDSTYPADLYTKLLIIDVSPPPRAV